ncbi:MAG TPA: hypothetical protein VGQ88_09380 [Burkholderiales bacterium]|nr:hypothetical protein [Burkholderiales bacterium]
MRYLFAFVVLCGCAADPEYQRQLATYGPWCERYGLLSGTEGFGNCVMWQSMIDHERKKAQSPR